MIQSLKFLSQSEFDRNENIDKTSSTSISSKSFYNAHTQNKTVICSVNQPTSDIFHCFTHVILMNHGRIAFQGTSKSAMIYFSK